jgi:hypothetical protein
MTDLEWFDPEPDPTAIERNPAPCRHPKYRRTTVDGIVTCSCGHVFDPVRVRAGRNNRKRGNAAELDTARLVGGNKVGPLGHPWDIEIPGYMRLQVKKLTKWPSLVQVAMWMDAIPLGRDMRGVVLTQPGRNARRLIVLDLAEFARWHGDPTRRDDEEGTR